MTDQRELEEMLMLYDVARVGDQMDYYEQRVSEYQRSASQTSLVSQILLLGASLCGLLSALQDERVIAFGIAAAGLAAVAAAVTAWADGIGFSANAELFSAARAGLARTRPTRPAPTEATAGAMNDYVDRIEGILLGEVGAWGETWRTGTDDPPSQLPPSFPSG